MMAPQPSNPLGFWEFTPLHHINFVLMERFGGSWHDPPRLSEGWEQDAALAGLRARAIQTISTYFTGSLWGFKDPRCCMTLPFWRMVIPNPIDCVIPIRNPLEVASSLLKRDGLPMPKGIALWSFYVAQAWKSSKGLRRHYTTYESVLDDSEVEIKRLAEFVGLKPGIEVISQALTSINPSLCHEHADQGRLAHYEAPPEIEAAYESLVKAASSQRDGRIVDEDQLDAIIAELR